MSSKTSALSLEFIRQNLVQHDLQMKALIQVNKISAIIKYHNYIIYFGFQDIVACRQSLEDLNSLNTQGRAKLSDIRKDIDALHQYARDNSDSKLMSEVESYRLQFTRYVLIVSKCIYSTLIYIYYCSSLHTFKNANISSVFIIQRNLKDDLLGGSLTDNEIRQRKKTDKSSLVKMSSGQSKYYCILQQLLCVILYSFLGITDQLLSISRQLSDTTQRSAETLDSLVNSSSNVNVNSF